jgi:hypothetical protein
MAGGFTSGSLPAASLEVTGKTFIDGPCSISIGGDAQFNTSQSPGAAISINPGASCVTFGGSGEANIHGDIGIEIVGDEETSLVFQILPNFFGFDGQHARTAFLGSNSTSVRFENVQGAIHGDVAAGLLIGDATADVTIYGQNLSKTPAEGGVQFTAEEDAPSDNRNDNAPEGEPASEIGGGENVPESSRTMPGACLRAMKNILLQPGPARRNAVRVDNFKTNRPGRGGTFFACRHALKHTPSSLAAVVGRMKCNGRMEQNCCGICWANASEHFAWDMYGLWSENRHRTAPPGRIACVGCSQECPLCRIRRGHCSIKPVLGLGVEHRIVRRPFVEGTDFEKFTGTLANFSMALVNNLGKFSLTAKAGLQHPTHSRNQSSRERSFLGKSHSYDVRCSRCFFRALVGELSFEKLSTENQSSWGLALIGSF